MSMWFWSCKPSQGDMAYPGVFWFLVWLVNLPRGIWIQIPRRDNERDEGLYGTGTLFEVPKSAGSRQRDLIGLCGQHTNPHPPNTVLKQEGNRTPVSRQPGRARRLRAVTPLSHDPRAKHRASC